MTLCENLSDSMKETPKGARHVAVLPSLFCGSQSLPDTFLGQWLLPDLHDFDKSIVMRYY